MSFVDEILEDFGAATLEDNFGVAATIRRGGQSTTGVIVEEIKEKREVTETAGISLDVASTAFVIRRDRYVFSGMATEPRYGDVIERVEQGLTEVFEVMADSMSPGCEPMPGGYRWLVRAKRIRVHA